jgi:hypothetical protein
MLPVGFEADGTLTINPGLIDVPNISWFRVLDCGVAGVHAG